MFPFDPVRVCSMPAASFKGRTIFLPILFLKSPISLFFSCSLNFVTYSGLELLSRIFLRPGAISIGCIHFSFKNICIFETRSRVAQTSFMLITVDDFKIFDPSTSQMLELTGITYLVPNYAMQGIEPRASCMLGKQALHQLSLVPFRFFCLFLFYGDRVSL